MQHPSASPSSGLLDWSALWRYGARWAGRPAPGIILPGPERLKIMTAVMESYMATFASYPGDFQIHAFIRSEAVRLALEATQKVRLAAAEPTLWHDATHSGSTPALDLADLQNDPSSPHWRQLLQTMRPRAIGLLTAAHVLPADAEDIFSESMAALVQVRRTGTAMLADVVVYELLPPLILTIVRRRMVNFIRDRQAGKRSADQTVSLHSLDGEAGTEHSSFANWAAEEADPLRGMTLAKLAAECAQQLTPLQQRILSVLYIEESASYMQVASSPWFASAAGLSQDCSDATRRRALDHQHDAALDQMGRILGINRRAT